MRPRTATRFSWSRRANAINATLYDKLNFNFIRDIAPVAGILRVAHVMVVNPSVPAKTVPEFIAYAKANPGKINMASAGHRQHQPCGRRTVQDDDRRRHGPRAVSRRARFPDLLGGQVQVMFRPMPSSIDYIRAGKLRALAVTTADALGGAAERPDRRRICAGLRGKRHGTASARRRTHLPKSSKG